MQNVISALGWFAIGSLCVAVLIDQRERDLFAEEAAPTPPVIVQESGANCSAIAVGDAQPPESAPLPSEWNEVEDPIKLAVADEFWNATTQTSFDKLGITFMLPDRRPRTGYLRVESVANVD